MTKVAIAAEGWNAEATVAFALAARMFVSSVTLTSGHEAVDGKDEIDVMTLGPERGEEILMTVDGRDEKVAFSVLLARLLSVIEAPSGKLEAVLGQTSAPQARVRLPRMTLRFADGSAAPENKKARRPPRRRVAEVAALDVEEVAPAHYRKRMRMRTGQLRAARSGRVHERADSCIRKDRHLGGRGKPSAARRRKDVQRKQEPKSGRTPTHKSRPRKRKK